jgi:DNA-directed RNA polymerase specialized sigma subunit
MNAQQSKSLESFRQGLRGFAWRLQYSSKVRHSKESLSLDERHYGYNFTSDVITTIYIKELLLMIPSEKARYIVKRLYLDGYTEKEVATELQLSQQAVSKWKKKAFKTIRENMNTH